MFPTSRAQAPGPGVRLLAGWAVGLVSCALSTLCCLPAAAATSEPAPPADGLTANECRGFSPCVTINTGPRVVPPGRDVGTAHTCPVETPYLVSWDVQGDPGVIVGVRKPLVGANGRQIGARFYLRQEDQQRPATVEIVLGCSPEKVVITHSIDQHSTGLVLPAANSQPVTQGGTKP